MKDLYHRNGLRPLEQDIVKIHNSRGENEGDSEAAFAILLNQERKKKYDKTHATLIKIGQLREHFGLNRRNDWHIRYADFVPDIFQPQISNTPPNFINEVADTKKSEKSRLTNKTAIVVGLVLVLGLLWVFSESSQRENANDETVQEEYSETYYVTSDGAMIQQEPEIDSAAISALRQFEDVEVFPNKSKNPWKFVASDNAEGYVQSDALGAGSGESVYLSYCAASGIGRLNHGSPLLATDSGPHTLIIINPPGDDAIVKLKNQRSDDVISYYVHGGETLRLDNIPSGDFHLYYATGDQFSSRCGIFTDNLHAWKERTSLSFYLENKGQFEYPKTHSYGLKNEFANISSVDARYF